jgi:ABC-type sugar transport system substrate-binding protein
MHRFVPSWRLAAALTLGAAALALAAAAQSKLGPASSVAPAAPADVTLALVLNDLTNPVSRPLRKGAQDAAKKFKFDLKIVGPSPATAQEQIALMQDLTAQDVDGIVILPVDSNALVGAINDAVEAGITVATTELDAPKSKRRFFYFGGSPTLLQGKMQADRVAAYFRGRGATGTINYVTTSCLPTVTGQQERRRGFDQEVAKLNKRNRFELKQIAFANTTTDPAKNLVNIQNLYTRNRGKMQVAYAMCGPDTQNWGTVLRRNRDKNILVAGYDWLPQTLDLIGQGWVAWAMGSSLYNEGLHTFTVLYRHFAQGRPLPRGATNGTSIFATKANLAKIRKSPDVTAAGG